MADPSTCPPLIPSSIRAAYSKIQPYIHKTPLLTSHSLDAIASSPDPTEVFVSSQSNAEEVFESTPKFHLFFKCENFQKIGAFKARGAFHAVTRLIEEMGLEEVRRRGVVTHSSGNHAQALALAAWTFSIPSYIVMPKISTPSKIAGTRLYTPNVLFSGSTSQEREAVVAQVVADKGAILVPPYDHPDIVLGQGTIGLEMEQQLEEHRQSQSQSQSQNSNQDQNTQSQSQNQNTQNQNPKQNQNQNPGPTLQPPSTTTTKAGFDAVITPLGGGGLLGGTATWFSDKPGTLVFGAEPSFEGADDGRRGLLAGARIEHVKSLTIADGLRTPLGLINFDILRDRNRLEGIYAVTEDQIRAAMRLVLERVKVVIEPSACVGLAVVLFNAEFRALAAQRQLGLENPVWDVGIVFSGGNTTVKAIAKLFADDSDSI
ncbi:threonine dehydratase [Capronia epimyces CBS 606.96]|uniref:Threonine dehydratase n=1 Tax=Capronia epimyces CBS 606.96 TaxID=1182542 RepID=W9YL11_9EURO|nr:threonine dehydratase [Capronia epimyces CBS 606.96]EXJ89911.1 threonine dehydratase [Capronia epimyces CBS 606.96]